MFEKDFIGPGRSGLIFDEPLLFELNGESDPGLNIEDVPTDLSKVALRRVPLQVKNIPEYRVVRHFTRMSQWNYSIENGFFPLGSCTMKHNPRINELIANFEEFAWLHPEAPVDWVQGAIEVLVLLENALKEMTGLAAFSLAPAAGAQGEFLGLQLIRAYFQDQGTLSTRRKILIPETAHGTNPASAALAGFEVINLPPQAGATMKASEIAPYLGPDIAALMLTNPNTLGVFESEIETIAKLVHDHGAFLYCDGANMNAILGKAKPAHFGVDVMHLNLHKTLSTPHGGGGPGCGPVGVCEKLVPFLPTPLPRKGPNGRFYLEHQQAKSVGSIKHFYGQFAVAVRALAYVMRLGGQGLTQASERAVLNANYIRKHLEDYYELPFQDPVLHEVVFSDKKQKNLGVTALDIAKALIDAGFHPPTIYFPLVVSGALMIEPTETEDKVTLDTFIATMQTIAKLAETGQTQEFSQAPQKSYRTRLDESQAARQPVLRWQPE